MAENEDKKTADKKAETSGGSSLFESALDEHTAHKTTFGARLRGYFLAGILVTAPIGITIYLTYVFVTFIDTRITNLIPVEYYPEMAIPGVGVVIALAFFIVVGWFAKNVLGRLLIRVSEYIVHRVPVIRQLYGAIKQVIETVLASQSQAFRDVVLLEYPRRGVWSIGFVTGRTEGEVQRVTADETVNVFVPTTPNPTSGYLLFVPRSQTYDLNMTVEEAVKLVVSAGIITPPDREKLRAVDEPATTNSLEPGEPKPEERS